MKLKRKFYSINQNQISENITEYIEVKDDGTVHLEAPVWIVHLTIHSHAVCITPVLNNKELQIATDNGYCYVLMIPNEIVEKYGFPLERTEQLPQNLIEILDIPTKE